MKVFLSYANESAAQTRELTTRLAAHGIEAIDPRGAASGSENVTPLSHQVENADALVFLLGPGSQLDREVQDQWRSAVQHSWSTPEKPMIPVVLGSAPLPGFLRNAPAIDAAESNDWDRIAAELAASLRTNSDSASTTAARKRASSLEQKQRLADIALEASKLEPSREEVAKQVSVLRARIAAAAATSLDPLERAELHVELADALKRLGEEAAALPELQAADTLLSTHPDAVRRRARVCANIGTLLARLGRKLEARAELEKARDLYIKAEGAQSIAALVARASLVQLLKDLGDEEAAAREQEAIRSDAKGLLRAFTSFIGGLFSGAGGKKRGTRT